MEFVAGGLNGKYLLEIHTAALRVTDSVHAAVAYASSTPRLFEDCWENGIKLTFWGRYDSGIPVTTNIIKKFLERKSPNYVCRLVPDIFHPKVIWWKGYGAYIGSANLTENAWFTNIEAGVFLAEDELESSGIISELENFFAEIQIRSHPLTDEVLKEMNKLSIDSQSLQKALKDAREKWERGRKLPRLDPLATISKKTANDRRRESFTKEWNETLQTLRNIAAIVSQEHYRPKWVLENVPGGVQADQFLHAYYYANVREGQKSTHWQLHVQNKSNPGEALRRAMEWWSDLDKPPHDEGKTIYENAPVLANGLKRGSVLGMSKDDFVQYFAMVHAFKDHSLRVRYTAYGASAPLPKMNASARVELLANWLYEQRSYGGCSPLETLEYVLYGGNEDELPSRIWEACSSDKWRVPHLGVSTLGEITGWVMPDIFPPRNGRTSKALTALGYNVKIHSE